MPVPRTAKPPVVFVNGYQSDCGSSSFAGTFGMADQILQSNGQASLFFDNCSIPNRPTIETLGDSFGSFLSQLKYQDGQPVELVDVVAHSMGGLIVRSYLSGKQSTSGSFAPPAAIRVRKAVLLATPHFGAGIAQLGASADAQLEELASGSRFLFDLATWNQGTDDLRGVDAIAAVGNGGTGQATMKGFDDGVVALTSASLAFYKPGRTRVLPYCHTDGGGLISLLGFCDSNAPGIAHIRATSQDTAQIIISFLNGTSAWQTVGVAAEQDPFLSVDGGLNVAVRSATDADLSVGTVTATSTVLSKKLNTPTDAVAYTDLFPAGSVTLEAATGSLNLKQSFVLAAGVYQALILKDGPLISRVFPSASATFPLSVAPGMIVSVYGNSLALNSEQASSIPLPFQLGGARVSTNQTNAALYYASASQINAIVPDQAAGLVQLTVQTTAGSDTVNVLVEPAVPAIYTEDGSGKGAAAALNARNNLVVSSGNPLHPGDYVELFLTGLGLTRFKNGLQYANQQPTITVGGENCPISFAGRSPVFPGLDQINCQIPASVAPDDAAPVIVTSGNRQSNTATLAVR